MDILALVIGVAIGLVVSVVLFGLLFLAAVAPSRKEKGKAPAQKEVKKAPVVAPAEKVPVEAKTETEAQPVMDELSADEDELAATTAAAEAEEIYEAAEDYQTQSESDNEVAADKEDDNSDLTYDENARIAAIKAAPELEDGKRYDRSFKARLMQADGVLKGWYSDIKNAALSLEGAKSSIAWKQERLRIGKTLIAKLIIRGKTLCVYFPITVEEAGNVKVEDVSKRAINSAAPTMLRIKNDRRARQAVALIKIVADKYGIKEGKKQNIDYAARFGLKTTDELLALGLIKVAEQTAFENIPVRK